MAKIRDAKRILRIQQNQPKIVPYESGYLRSLGLYKVIYPQNIK